MMVSSRLLCAAWLALACLACAVSAARGVSAVHLSYDDADGHRVVQWTSTSSAPGVVKWGSSESSMGERKLESSFALALVSSEMGDRRRQWCRSRCA